MIESTIVTGTRGLMKVQDNTDGTNKTVDLYVASSAPIAVPSLPWSYSIDGAASDTKSFNFTNTTAWQHLGKIFVGWAAEFIFHLGDTGHVELGGPTDLTVDLANQTNLVSINVNGVYKKAIPYVNVAGVWQPAQAMVMDQSTWKIAT